MDSTEKICEAEKFLIETIELYYFKFKSPRKLGRIIWDNLQLAYLWTFIIVIGLLVWGFVVIPFDNLVTIVVVLAGLFTIYELISFFTYRGFRYESRSVKCPYVKSDNNSRNNDTIENYAEDL